MAALFAMSFASKRIRLAQQPSVIGHSHDSNHDSDNDVVQEIENELKQENEETPNGMCT